MPRPGKKSQLKRLAQVLETLVITSNQCNHFSLPSGSKLMELMNYFKDSQNFPLLLVEDAIHINITKSIKNVQ